MFRHNIRGRNIEVTEMIHDYVEREVGRLERYFGDAPDATAHVNSKVYIEKTVKVKVTIPLSYLVLRAEGTPPDLYASIDLVVDRSERQIHKFKTKINRKSRETGMNTADATTLFNEEDESENDFKLDIVRTEHLSSELMGSEEAILQINMLGHNFFIFEDAETSGTSIVYHRRNGKYGLIETDWSALLK